VDVPLDLLAIIIVRVAAEGVAPVVVGLPDAVADSRRVGIEIGVNVVVVEDAAQILQLLVVAVSDSTGFCG
jgi:hypothetical protein